MFEYHLYHYEHFPLAHLPHFAAYIRRCFSYIVCSFAILHFCTKIFSQALASLLSALLCYACAPLLISRLRSSPASHLQPHLSSCLTSLLFLRARHPRQFHSKIANLMKIFETEIIINQITNSLYL